LHAAVVSHKEIVLEVVKLLLEGGALVNQANKKGNTPFHLAVSLGKMELVQLLLERGVLVNQANKDGNSPLHLVAILGHLKIMHVLVFEGQADLDLMCGSDGNLTAALIKNCAPNAIEFLNMELQRARAPHEVAEEQPLPPQDHTPSTSSSDQRLEACTFAPEVTATHPIRCADELEASNQLRLAQERLRQFEVEALKAEERVWEAEGEAHESRQLQQEAETRARDAEERAKDAEERAQETEKHVREAEDRAQKLETKTRRLEGKLGTADRRLLEVEAENARLVKVARHVKVEAGEDISAAWSDASAAQTHAFLQHTAATRSKLKLEAQATEHHTEQAALRDKLDQSECVVCLDTPKTVCLFPCNHVCLCEACSKDGGNLTPCPICRQAVTSQSKIFMA
jgi:hypothetical protein